MMGDHSSVLEKVMRVAFSACGYSGSNYPWKESLLIRRLLTKKFDFVFIDHSLYGKLAGLIKRASPSTFVITHFHNVESEYALSAIKAPFLFKKILSHSAFINERAAFIYSNFTICLSRNDKETLRAIYKKDVSEVIPLSMNISNDTDQLLHVSDSKYILFCGSNFLPNITGLKWFIRNVLPKIPYQLVIIGSDMERLDFEKNPQIDLVGTVSDVSPFYKNAFAVICPVFTGSGMKTKTIEALRYGKATFGTTVSWAGIDHSAIDVLYRCDSAENFVTAIEKHSMLYQQNYFKHVSDFFRKNFSTEVKVEKYRNLISSHLTNKHQS